MALVLLATCSRVPGRGRGRSAARPRFARHDLDAVGGWDDPDVDWSAVDVILRSTWDYPLHRDPSRPGPRACRCWTTRRVVRWTATRSTCRARRRRRADRAHHLSSCPARPVEFPLDRRFVVKPSVGAGSRGAGRFGAGAVDGARRARARAARRRPDRTGPAVPGRRRRRRRDALDVLRRTVQPRDQQGPMLPDGAVHASAPTTGLFVPERISARRRSAEVARGRPGPGLRPRPVRRAAALRARRPAADSVRTGVIELELVEPSLFLSYADQAPDRFATAIAAIA